MNSIYVRYYFLFLGAVLIFPIVSHAAIGRTLTMGMAGEDVRELQQLLNSDSKTQVAKSGPGSPGFETSYFGPATQEAVKRYQQLFADAILRPNQLVSPTGVVGKSTREHLSQNSSKIQSVSFDPELATYDVDAQIPTQQEIDTLRNSLFMKVSDMKKRIDIKSAEITISGLQHSIEVEKAKEEFRYVQNMQKRLTQFNTFVDTSIDSNGDILPGVSLPKNIHVDAVSPVVLLPGRKATLYGSGFVSGQKVTIGSAVITNTQIELYGLGLSFIVPSTTPEGMLPLFVEGLIESPFSIRVIKK